MTKSIYVPLLTLAVVPLLSLIAQPAKAEPAKVAAEFSRAYLPVGFDSNDNVQIVAEGMFKNSCYRPAETTIDINKKRHTVSLGPVAYEYNGLCLQLILPFERTLDLGILEQGDWTIQRKDGTKLGDLHVARATKEDPDDYLYAPISQTYFHQDGAVSKVALEGEFSNSCMSLKEVRTDIQKDVIVVQPIAEFAQRPDCKDGHFPFNRVTNIEMIPPGRYMLHVRSMNARAVTTLVDVK